jgi:glutaryl-CoA dehydrogenase
MAMTTTMPYQHLGQALATDYFFVREQFTDEQWEHFLRTRRFVDEEVLPVINDYWERAELAWPLFRRMGELGLVGDDIADHDCPGMSSLAAGLVHMEINRGDGSLGTFLGASNPALRCGRSTCSAPTSSASAGFRAWRASSRPAPSP